jgi:predicted DCC family thiol-disulfide oxidoreductase YuxK
MTPQRTRTVPAENRQNTPVAAMRVHPTGRGAEVRVTPMNDWPFRILYDGECPLCKREADLLRRMDRGRGRLELEDIAAPEFDASKYGLTFDAVMGSIHGVLPGNRIVHGMEVFRRAYGLVGWGWALAPTGWPILKPLFDRFYVWFAANRLRLTGRPCDSGRCAPRRA